MRELTLIEMSLVGGAGNATDTVNTTVTTGGAGYAAGRVFASAAGGAVNGSRAGLYGAIAGAVIGTAAGLYDWYQDVQDGSDYGDGTNY